MNPTGTKFFTNCTVSLVTFLDKGCFKDTGLTDLSNFMEWIKDGASTKTGRAAMKKALGPYYAGCVYPLFLRILFHYANKHGGNEGTEAERMARVIQAFKVDMSPPTA